MKKEIIHTDNAPKAFGAYSQAILVENPKQTLYCTGQIPVNPTTGSVVDGEASEQTTQVIENLKAVLNEAGMSLQDVVKCDVYLNNIEDIKVVNEVYAQYFDDIKPARVTVVVEDLPLNVLVEISCIACK